MNGLRLLFALLCLAFIAVSAKAVQSYSIAGVQPDPMLAVVKIITDKGHGSGFHMGNGHIITAAHVLRGATSVKVKSSGLDVQDAEILWSNDTYDVALIAAKLPKRFGTVPLACREAAEGETIIAMGNPLKNEFVRFWGHIAGKARETGPWKSVLVADISGAPGISGGPVFDASGTVIGIFVGLQNFPIGMGASFVGISAVVPSTAICNLLARPVDGKSERNNNP